MNTSTPRNPREWVQYFADISQKQIDAIKSQREAVKSKRNRKRGGGRNRGYSGIVIHGIEEIKAALDKVTDEIAVGAMQRAGRRAANIIKDEAKRLCPRKTVALRDSIHVVENYLPRYINKYQAAHTKAVNLKKINYAVMAGEGFFAGKTYYSGMVEFGTKFMSARPFLRPAYRAKKHLIIQAYRNEVAKVVNNRSLRRANAAISAITEGIE